ncbi:MAG: GNAT family N-acetyltransferase [Candidatus Heimdallarchaeota archaeon]|nr:GNAT family N-acetyltransferase [Candidatus Heimdallarchaeota archaeon]
MNLSLSLENYKKKWYDLEGKYIVKEKHDFLKFHKYFKLKKGRKSHEFRLKALHEVSTDKIARLMNKTYSDVDFIDNVVLLSKNYSSYNISIMMKLISGYYGRLSNTISMLIENNKGELVGYIINMDPQDGVGVIVDFAIDPKYRGIGLGKVLFRNTIIKYFEEKKCEEVSFAVSSGNDIAKVLYLKNGFEIVGKEEKEGFLFVD